MIKPNKLERGDKIAIISLSRGLLGEPFMERQKKLIEKRINDFGLEVIYTPNALKGIEYLEKNPLAKADDLKWAFKEDSIKGIICAIGGDDTYRTVPYLLSDEEFINNVKANPKVFIGYSDTTINHLMFQRIGLTTYYGPAAIVDFGELANEMLPYSKMWFEKLFSTESDTEITSSPVWYLERTSFGESEFGKDRIIKKEENGYEILNGSGKTTGKLFGGCIESLSELLSGDRYSDEPEVNAKFNLFPTLEELSGKILFLETSEEQPTPDRLSELLSVLDQYGVFEVVNGVIIGKPQDGAHYDEYKKIYMDIIGKYNKPILFNMNFGHSHPRCILPYGIEATIDCDNKKIIINEPLVLEKQNIKK
jgi:Uncharacterized proteins, homologs of microcin C7 resistance protein MccF